MLEEILIEEAERKKNILVKAWIKKDGGHCYYIGTIEKEDGEFVFWLNSAGENETGRFLGQKRKWRAEEALQNALKYATFGWCTLTDFEMFVFENKGPLLEKSMEACGFRPSKFGIGWARIKKETRRKRIKKE